VRGVFYAQVDPSDPSASMWIEQNRRLDACVIRFVSQDEHVARVRKWVDDEWLPEAAKRYPRSVVADIRQKIADGTHDFRLLDGQYRNAAEKRGIRVVGACEDVEVCDG